MATSGSVKSGTAGSGGRSYFQVDWSRSSVSIPNNKSTISWTLKLIAGNYWYTNAVRIDYVKINGTTVKGSETYSNKINNTYTLASGTLDIPHNSDGTKTFTIELSGWFYEDGTRTGSGSFTLDTIPRASTMSVPTFTAGTAGTFSISRASSSFTHTIQYKFGSIGWTAIVTKTSSTSVSWTPPLSLLQQMAGAASKTETNGLWLATYSGNTLIGEKYYNLTIQAGSDAKPTVTGFTVSANPAVLGKYVQGRSRIQFAITGSGYQGSSIAGYEFQGAGETLNPSSGEGNTNILSNVPSDPTTLTLKGWVKDSRGKWSDASTQTIVVYPYTQPQLASLSVQRADSAGNPDESGTTITIQCVAQVGATIGGDNTLSVAYVVKDQETDTEISSGTVPATGTANTYYKQITGVEIAHSYLVVVTLADTVGSIITRTVAVPTARVTMHLREGGRGVAFGGYSTIDDTVDFTDWHPIGMVLGLGRARAMIASNDDFNSYVTPGVYGVSSTAIASTLSNKPCSYAGVLRVFTGNGSDRGTENPYHYVIQEYVDLNADMYIRSGGSGTTPGVYTWDAWKKVTMTTV